MDGVSLLIGFLVYLLLVVGFVFAFIEGPRARFVWAVFLFFGGLVVLAVGGALIQGAALEHEKKERKRIAAEEDLARQEIAERSFVPPTPKPAPTPSALRTEGGNTYLITTPKPFPRRFLPPNQQNDEILRKYGAPAR